MPEERNHDEKLLTDEVADNPGARMAVTKNNPEVAK